MFIMFLGFETTDNDLTSDNTNKCSRAFVTKWRKRSQLSSATLTAEEIMKTSVSSKKIYSILLVLKV